MFKCFAIIVLMSLAVGAAAAAASAADLVGTENPAATDEPTIVHEAACLSAGGVCVRRGDCPRGLAAAARGLCPASQRRGYICCHAVPLSERRCGALGGACLPRCNAAVQLPRASDCGAQPCCLLE